jgi:hypothetical protein
MTMMADEDLWELTLEQLHLEYQATRDAGGGDLTQEFHERIVWLLTEGLPTPTHAPRSGMCDRHRTEVRDHGDGRWLHTDDQTECDSTIKLGETA